MDSIETRRAEADAYNRLHSDAEGMPEGYRIDWAPGRPGLYGYGWPVVTGPADADGIPVRTAFYPCDAHCDGPSDGSGCMDEAECSGCGADGYRECMRGQMSEWAEEAAGTYALHG